MRHVQFALRDAFGRLSAKRGNGFALVVVVFSDRVSRIFHMDDYCSRDYSHLIGASRICCNLLRADAPQDHTEQYVVLSWLI